MELTKPIKSFSDLGINKEQMPGRKISIKLVLNREIIITAFRIDKSKYPNEGNGLRLTLQIFIDNEQRVIFTSSLIIQDQINQVPEFPIKAIIVPLEPIGYKLT